MAKEDKLNNNEIVCCASCGATAGDDIKLKDCTACKLVKYCGVKCQKDHWPQHKKECKKRAAELRDEILFKQPESSHEEDCPICLVPLSLDENESILMMCCSKTICLGCDHAYSIRSVKDKQEPTCPFCRNPQPQTREEAEKILMKRIQANDPVALCHEGKSRYINGDPGAAFQYLKKAAELGDITAHNQLSLLYDSGQGVEKDVKKRKFHMEEAAIGGHSSARYNLACFEERNGRFDRALKHLIIAANMGHDASLESLKKFYRMGLVGKEDFAATLRGHQAAVDATKSPQREAAYAVRQKWKNAGVAWEERLI